VANRNGLPPAVVCEFRLYRFFCSRTVVLSKDNELKCIMAGALQSFNQALSVAMTWVFVAAPDSWA
jgi:hypothetical protein